MGLMEMQQAVKDKHFRKGIYYKKLVSLTIDNEDEMEDGSPFQYKRITDEKTLAYLGNHISIQQNDVVIETYAPIEWVIKGKVKLEVGRLLQVKTITPTEIPISPISRIIKYTITLG